MPVGVGQANLETASLTIHEHDHVVIIGPPRSGRSTLLATVAIGLLRAVDGPVFSYAPRSSPLRDVGGAVHQVGGIEELRGALKETARPPVVLVDDADVFDDFSGVFLSLVTHQNPAVHVVVVARNDGPVRSSSHWLAMARRSRCGALLMPDALDGDMFGVTLPRRPALAMRPGRGYLVVDGAFTAIQSAVPG